MSNEIDPKLEKKIQEEIVVTTPIAQIEITLNVKREVELSGTLGNKILSLGLLQMAIAIISSDVRSEKKEKSRILS